MKLFCNNTFINIICTMIKYIVALLSNSLCLFSDAMYDAGSILKESSLFKKNDDNKKKNRQSIYNVIIGALIILMGFLIILNIFSVENYKVKWYVVLVSVITFLMSNISNSLKYVIGFNSENKEIVNLSRDFKYTLYFPLIVIVCYVITLFSKYLDILKYADLCGAFIISLLIILMGIKHIYNNINGINKVNETVIEIFKNNTSIKNVKYEILSYGYSKKLILNVTFDKNVQTVNIYSNIMELCYEIFKKYGDIEVISLIKSSSVERKTGWTNARNSGSRNSKKNTTKKSSKQKNKKR